MRDNEIIEEAISNFGNLTDKLCLGSAVGQVFGTLYFKGDKTQHEIKDELGIALSSTSQSLVMLESFGLVSVASKKGRKNVYSAEIICKKNVFESILMFHLEPLQSLLKTRSNLMKDKENYKKMNRLSELCMHLNKKLRRLV